MSTEVYEGNQIQLTQFSGGADRGRCLQIMVGHRFVQLTYEQALVLQQQLDNWLRS